MAKAKSTMDIMKTVRGTWGNVNPVTRVHGTQKGYSKKNRKEGKREANSY